MFTEDVRSHLRFYVYRLIDPRNGETFYVGKGAGNRVFSHAAGELSADDDQLSEKLKRIREIELAGFETAHVIHRHGLDSDTAFEVEAALMDAYPGITNIAGGTDGGDRGVMHAEEIIARFRAEPADFKHAMVAIKINKSASEKSVYEAVRYAWKLKPERAQKAEYVLAVLKGLIVGVYVPTQWLAATVENFPGTAEARPGRTGFIGDEAPDDIQSLYLRKRMPDEAQGAANPVRYINI